MQTEHTEQTERALWPSPGQKLQKLREELGYSREKISETMHITVHYVRSLENDEYEKLPGHTFIKGYFRSYANLLGADVEDILLCYMNQIEAGKNTAEQEARDKEAQDNKKTTVWVVAGIITLAVLVIVAIWFISTANS